MNNLIYRKWLNNNLHYYLLFKSIKYCKRLQDSGICLKLSSFFSKSESFHVNVLNSQSAFDSSFLEIRACSSSVGPVDNHEDDPIKSIEFSSSFVFKLFLIFFSDFSENFKRILFIPFPNLKFTGITGFGGTNFDEFC